jgi:RNA polymerase sigma-70 factor, ECF subfamily
MPGTETSISQLLELAREGSPQARDRLLEALYPELRRLAARLMRLERASHTLQPTALANEACVRLLGEMNGGFTDRAHFLGMAATLMRNILVDHARRRCARKRGSGNAAVDIDMVPVGTFREPEEMIAIDRAIDRLSSIDPRPARIVELHFFGGLTNPEIAEVLQVSERTVKRDWAMARAWLHRELSSNRPNVARSMEAGQGTL